MTGLCACLIHATHRAQALTWGYTLEDTPMNYCTCCCEALAVNYLHDECMACTQGQLRAQIEREGQADVLADYGWTH